MDVLATLRDRANELSKGMPDDSFKIRGLWRTDLMFRPNANERTFRFTYVLAQTLGQGCSYCDSDVVLDESLMGQDARKVRPESIGVEIAVLDAIYSAFEKRPEEVHVITGTSVVKTPARTKIVVDEVVRQMELTRSAGRLKKSNPTVVNVGVVGNFIKEFVKLGYDVLASDYDTKLVGTEINGVQVVNGDKTLEFIERSDVAVATGMTIATHTLGPILDVARKSGTKLVLFAETGANFGQEYCGMGVDAVVAEPFPFYIFQGSSTIEVYRRQE